MATMWAKNGWRGFWVLLLTFAKYVFWLEQPFHEKHELRRKKGKEKERRGVKLVMMAVHLHCCQAAAWTTDDCNIEAPAKNLLSPLKIMIKLCILRFCLYSILYIFTVHLIKQNSLTVLSNITEHIKQWQSTHISSASVAGIVKHQQDGIFLSW